MKNPFPGLFRARDKPARRASPRDAVYAAPGFYYGASLSGKSVTPTSAIQVSAVYACVRVIAETVASLPLHVYEATDTGSRKAGEHPLYRLLHDEPNAEMTSFVWREVMLSHLLLYALPRCGADGTFGAETEAALRAFQADAGLEADGKYGEKSHAAMMEATADGGKDGRPAQPEPPDAEKPSVSGTVVIVSDGGKVNVREGNGLTYGRITQLAPGTTCPYIATAGNGWHAVVVGKRVGWVSPEYSRVI